MCEYCESPHNNIVDYDSGYDSIEAVLYGNILTVSFGAHGEYFDSVEKTINFCPMCGRSLKVGGK